MIGDRIKEIRLWLGISQRQLAGTKLTRSYISIIEAGKANPSDIILQYIAEKLGVTVCDLKNSSTSPDKPNPKAITYLTTARLMFEQSDYHNAHALLEDFFNTVTDLGMLTEGKKLSIKVLAALNKYEDALSESKKIIDQLIMNGQNNEVANLYFEMGQLAFSFEDYVTAQRAYERAVLCSSNHKNLSDLHTNALMALAWTLLIFGSIDESIGIYTRVYDIYRLNKEEEKQGDAAMGASTAFFKINRIEESLSWTEASLIHFQRADSKRVVFPLHNLANIRQVTGKHKEALELYESCYKQYGQLGLTAKQASLLEDMAAFWLRKGNYDKSKSCCYGALGLLDRDENWLIRGRVYRVLGKFMLETGQVERAYHVIRISYDMFRKMGINHESEKSKLLLDEVSQKLENVKIIENSIEPIIFQDNG